MSRGERERLKDIKDAIRAIREHLAVLEDDPDAAELSLLRDALLYQLVVIGEAVKNLSRETRAADPSVPWDDIAGMRDLIAHEYFRIEMDLVLDTVQRDLTPLEEAIDRLLGST